MSQEKRNKLSFNANATWKQCFFFLILLLLQVLALTNVKSQKFSLSQNMFIHQLSHFSLILKSFPPFAQTIFIITSSPYPLKNLSVVSTNDFHFTSIHTRDSNSYILLSQHFSPNFTKQDTSSNVFFLALFAYSVINMCAYLWL